MAVCIADSEVIVQNFRKHIVIISKRRTEPKHPEQKVPVLLPQDMIPPLFFEPFLLY